MIRVEATGIIYRNPKTHVRSIQAYFPSVVVLSEKELVATVVLGEAFEAANAHTYVFRSTDSGETWALEQQLSASVPGRLTSDASRITRLPDGTLLVFMVRSDRTDYPEEGLTNPDTLGFVPTELLLLRSTDGGRTWAGPVPMQPPLEGPSFELCSPITVLRDGRLVLPTSTWPGWDGACANGVKMVGLVSHDTGQTWPEYWDVMKAEAGRIFYWESKIIELGDGRLVAVAWAYDDVAAKDMPNHFAVSQDGGRTWSAPTSTGLLGQTLTPCALEDGGILCVYRRMDDPGLWAARCRLDGRVWRVEEQEPLWGARTAGLTRTGANMSQNFAGLRFGAPCIARMNDGGLFVAFWCYEDAVSNIRWLRLRVE